MKRALLAFMLLAALPSRGQNLPLRYNYDVDGLSYVYVVPCTPPIASATTCGSPGPGKAPSGKATTSGSSATVTSVSSSDPFAGMAKGDLIVFQLPAGDTQGGSALRQVASVASANSITVDNAITLPAAGVNFKWWTFAAGSGAEDGWFSTKGDISENILIDIVQISVTGGIDYTVQCRQALAGGSYSSPFDVVATTNKTTVAVSQAAWSLSGTAQGPWDQCRVGLKIGTGDDDGITFVVDSVEDIDFKEYINSYTIAGTTDDTIRIVEDSGGTPFNCDATLTPATYTGATLCTEIATQLNACGGTNTYSCAYSTTTHKFTLARATGAVTMEIAWSGDAAHNLAAATLGYTADDTGGTSYVSDSATGESAELTATLTPGLYSGSGACAEVQTMMQAQAIASTISCSYSSTTDKATISATGITQLMILWNSGTNNADSADSALGFGADSTGALTYTGSAIGTDAANEIEKVTITVAGYK